MARTGQKPRASRAGGAIEAHLDALRHPERAVIDALRSLIASAVPDAVEEIKWNAPSFAKSVHFATLHLRAKRGVQLVLHLGAKPRTDADMRTIAADDTGLLDWKGPDRAIVAVNDIAHLKAHAHTLRRIVTAWARVVDPAIVGTAKARRDATRTLPHR